MVETLILGFVLGVLTTSGGVILAACKWGNPKVDMFKTTDGCIIGIFDKTYDNDKYNMLGIKDPNGDIITGIRFDNTGVKDIKCDVVL